MRNKLKLAFSSGMLFLFFGCNNPMAIDEAHGIGKKTFYIEESYKPLFETSIYTFEGQNPMADIVPEYVTEEQAIQAFFEGKTETICITRDFTKEEKATLKKSQIEVRSDMLAKDAVALIVNPENPDTTITIEKLKRILTGKDTVWDGLKTGINVVFDNVNSANFIYMRNLTGKGEVPKNVFAVKSNEEVIEYVKNNRSAIGFIGVNWISDEDDPQSLAFLNGIKVMEVAEKEGKEYFKPFQSYIYTKEYPLTREVWLINMAGRNSLNMGFILFLLGERGQLIIQKSSLIPANMVARMIQIKTE